jgi:hypothetical protein
VLDRNRLSRPRVTDDRHRLAFEHIEGEPFEDTLRAEGFVDVDEANHD